MYQEGVGDMSCFVVSETGSEGLEFTVGRDLGC